MASTLTKILLHITCSTKEREPTIAPEFEPDLHAYMGGICRRMESPALAVGGTADHVHLMVSISKNLTLPNLMLHLKRDSSKWVGARVPTFHWQDGYFGFSIGQSGVEELRRYIASQKQHHARIDFKDEVRGCCGSTRWNGTRGTSGIDRPLRAPLQGAMRNGTLSGGVARLRLATTPGYFRSSPSG